MTFIKYNAREISTLPKRIRSRWLEPLVPDVYVADGPL